MNTAHTAAARPRRPSLLAAAALAALLLVACEQPGQSAAVPAASTAQPPVPAPQQEEEQLPPWDEDLPAEPAQETTQLWDGVPPLRATGALHNFGSSTAAWLRKMRHLARGNNADIPKSGAPEVLRILVLGDSHTAGGYLTDALRQRLQARLGAAGPGWAQPIQIRGQNTTTIETNGWLASNSRDNAGAQEDTLGGVNATSDGGELALATHARGAMRLSLLARSDNPGVPPIISDSTGRTVRAEKSSDAPGWQLLVAEGVRPPLYIRDPLARWTLAAIGLENGWPGATVSAFGINGAQILETAKWRRDWAADLAHTHADLVILQYGTNEIYGGIPNWNRLGWHWRRTLTAISQALPQAGLLIAAAPESLASQEGDCGTPPAALAQMQAMQRRLAERYGTLYWSWQDAMGGACSMRRWMDDGLAGSDGVHFSREGYARIGRQLANELLTLALGSGNAAEPVVPVSSGDAPETADTFDEASGNTPDTIALPPAPGSGVAPLIAPPAPAEAPHTIISARELTAPAEVPGIAEAPRTITSARELTAPTQAPEPKEEFIDSPGGIEQITPPQSASERARSNTGLPPPEEGVIEQILPPLPTPMHPPAMPGDNAGNAWQE